MFCVVFFCIDTATTEIYTYGPALLLHDALPCSGARIAAGGRARRIDFLERCVAMIIWALRDHEIGDPFTRDGDAVEDNLAGAHLDRIAGKADPALDLILLVGGRSLAEDRKSDVSGRSVSVR